MITSFYRGKYVVADKGYNILTKTIEKKKKREKERKRNLFLPTLCFVTQSLQTLFF